LRKKLYKWEVDLINYIIDKKISWQYYCILLWGSYGFKLVSSSGFFSTKNTVSILMHYCSFRTFFQSELFHGRLIAHCWHIMWVDELFCTNLYSFKLHQYHCNRFWHRYWQISSSEYSSDSLLAYWFWYFCNQCI
jgi:hypothetical protein